MPEYKEENHNVALDPQMDTKFKAVSALATLASFPSNIGVYGQNQDERILLFVRKDKVILIFNLLIQIIAFFMPFVLQMLLYFLNDNFLEQFKLKFDLDMFFTSKYWTAVLLLWAAYVLKGLYNIFFQWFYDINILTTNRFIDLDLINIFHNRLEETSILNIEDVRDMQSGIIQSLFHMGDLEVYTASGQTVFNLNDVPRSSKIRDFIMDVVLEERRKYGDAK
jgi:hypothetical protein